MFTVVIPTYNRANLIHRALDSVLSQLFEDWECIVVDDFSTDNTKDIVAQYIAKDKRFCFIQNERTKGACGARNTGVLHANGEYVSFLDSDDEYVQETLQLQYQAFQSNPNYGMVYSRLSVYEEGIGFYPFGEYMGLQGEIYKDALTLGYIAPTDVISAKKDCLLAVGLFDETLPASQDDDLCFKLAKSYEIGYIDDSLAIMHLDAANRITNVFRPAIGWWMLWNKYEHDVLALCGKKTMAHHYKQCLVWFIRAKMPVMIIKALVKVVKNDWKLSFKQWVGSILVIFTGTKITKVNRKVIKWISE